MRVLADRVGIDGPHGTLLPATSLDVATGQLVVVHGSPGAGITALGLALAGRMKPGTGTITVDEHTGPKAAAELRRRVAVVDAPSVSEPDEALPLRVVAGEELALAGRPARRENVDRWLADHDAATLAGSRFELVEPQLRTRLLTALAAERPGVQMLVLDTPDRHTSESDDWYMLAHEHAERGLAVVVLTATTPPETLPVPVARIGAHQQPAPTRCDETTENTENTGTGATAADTTAAIEFTTGVQA